jgi:SAM-dependent methyltransferase
MTAESALWNRVEASDSPGRFVSYLDTATAQASMQAYKQLTYRLLALQPGQQVLDLGCGTGEDAQALAERVGPSGQALGVDNSSAMIDTARQRHGQVPGLAFRRDDAETLTLDDESFHGVRIDRVLMHLQAPEFALRHAVRVLRPGGRLVVREPDWGTLLVDAPDRALTRRIVDGHFDRVIRHPWIGRGLYAACRDLGLGGVDVADASTLTLTDLAVADRLFGLRDASSALADQVPALADDCERWWQALVERSERGRFFCAVTGFTVVGRKPGGGLP